jgi:hypothetical protein
MPSEGVVMVNVDASFDDNMWGCGSIGVVIRLSPIAYAFGNPNPK